jgi:hypothetical protein
LKIQGLKAVELISPWILTPQASHGGSGRRALDMPKQNKGPPMEFTKLWCRCLRIFFQIMTFFFPVFLVVFWIIPETIFGVINYLPVILPIDSYTVGHWQISTKLLGAFISFIPGGFTVFIFLKLSKLFRLYEEGIFLSPRTLRLVRKIGVAVLCKELLFPFYIVVLYYVVTKDYPSERHFLPVSFSNANFTVIVMACLIIIISNISLKALKVLEARLKGL